MKLKVPSGLILPGRHVRRHLIVFQPVTRITEETTTLLVESSRKSNTNCQTQNAFVMFDLQKIFFEVEDGINFTPCSRFIGIRVEVELMEERCLARMMSL